MTLLQLLLLLAVLLPINAGAFCWNTDARHRTKLINPSHRCRLRRKLYSGKNKNYDDEDDDDEEPPDVDVKNFQMPKFKSPPTFGYGRGRSSPSLRKAMGTSGKSSTTVYVCTNCGSESVQWRGKCPTCNEWNTLQPFAVPRTARSSSSSSNGPGLPLFSRPAASTPAGQDALASPSTWLDGIDNGDGPFGGFSRPISIKKVDTKADQYQRLEIPYDDELNTVLGGGLLKGSLILLGGDPGVGKSTLALQMANQVASLATPSVGIGMGPSTPNLSGTNPIGPVWYVSGEETLAQIATRAERLSATAEELYLLAETNLNVLADQIVQLTHYQYYQQEQSPKETDDENFRQQALPPSLIIIDSIQTVFCEEGTGGTPGGVSQVRESMALLLRLAKSTQIPIVVIGHVTKSGDVAGPKMVEHMVDAVLYLESSEGGATAASSSGSNPYRWLRASKNRFGSTQVVGLYEFTQGQLIPNPDLDGASTLPLEDLEGCAMGVTVEGTHRAMTVEVQALVTLASGGGNGGSYGKKTVNGGGFSYQRLQLLMGVLQKHCGVYIGRSRDVYVNIVGGGGGGTAARRGGSVTDLDLAVALALTSSLASIPVRGDTACLAQVGLLGELRSLGQMESRLVQAQRMGFSRAIVAGRRFRTKRQYGMDIIECPTLVEALNLGLTNKLPKKNRSGKETAVSSRRNRAPERLEDLELGDTILDDDEDDIFGETEAFL